MSYAGIHVHCACSTVHIHLQFYFTVRVAHCKIDIVQIIKNI